MTRPITHDDASAELHAAALDALDDDELADVLAHAGVCPECGPELAALTEAVASLGLAAPRVPIEPDRDAALRDRLLRRAGADAGRRSTLAPRRPWGGAPGWFALAAGIVGVASLSALALTWRDRDRLRVALSRSAARQAALAARVDSLRATLAVDERTLASLSGPRVRVVELAAAGARPPVGRMFWDQATSRWTFFAHNLPQLAAGRTYQLWLVTRGARISAGTFAPDSAGQAVVRAEYPLAPDALQAIAVTEEPAGGVPQPTGPPVIAGAATR